MSLDEGGGQKVGLNWMECQYCNMKKEEECLD